MPPEMVFLIGAGALQISRLTWTSRHLSKKPFLVASTRQPPQNSAGMKGLSVAVIGQDAKSAITDRNGSFKIQDVLTIGEHPVYLDVTLSDKNFKHRYKVMSDKTEGLVLFHLQSEQVSYWIGQLEGGVSPVSGLIVSADRDIKSSEVKRPLPQVIPLLERPTLVPETYTLSPEDHLMVKTPMRAGQARFISVQVPEGANLSSLISADGRVPLVPDRRGSARRHQ